MSPLQAPGASVEGRVVLRWKQTALGPASENAIARLYNVNSTPATVLVDASGRIVALNLTGEELVRRIDQLLRP